MQKLELTWIGKGKEPDVEPRILLHDASRDYGDPTAKNMIIHGDNLLALKALEQEFAGQVKCIYIDPPYNAKATGVPYDDNIEHSYWLSLMRQRLIILYNLLASNGVIVVHIDDRGEHAYLKVLMDEVFSRKNYVNTITVRDSHPSGLKLSAKEKTIIKTKSHMLVYKKEFSTSLIPIYQQREKWDTHFNIFIDIDDMNLEKCSLKDIAVKKGIIDKNEKITEDILKNAAFKEFAFNNKDKIFQSTKEIPENAKNRSLEIPNTVIEYSSGKERNFAFNGRRLSPLSKSWQEVGIDGAYKLEFAKLLCDFWDDVDFNNSQNEGGVAFPASKKPEFLVARILTMFSNANDLVLDSFLGSGTTAAVAHKMGRRYIGIELGEHAYTHCVPRLKAVVNGEMSGISSMLNWQGGGGFKFYELAPTLIVKDENGFEIISDKYDPNMLAAAVVKLCGYRYAPCEGNPYIHGVNNVGGFIFVTTQYITASLLGEIAENFVDTQSLVICASAFQIGIKNNYPNIKLRKIPQSVLSKCEYGADNYNLNVVELPDFDETEEDFEDAE